MRERRRVVRSRHPRVMPPRRIDHPWRQMRRLIVSEFVTLDGIMEAPGFEEHRTGRQAWALRLQNDETQRFNRDQLFAADALLFGRTTFQIWAAFWPTAPDDEGLASRMNEIPKYVVSTTLKDVAWTNTVVLAGDVTNEVAALKREPGGDIFVLGSADLVAELMKHDLVDEYRLMVFPVVLGSGKHLFRDGIDIHHMRLVETRTFSTGVVFLGYEPARGTPTSEFVETYAWTEEQVRSLQAAQDTDRVLATILFTDIVDSTGRAAAAGDRQWRLLLDRHDELTRAEVARWQGRFIKTTGDGILATFDTPTRALRCAFALGQSLAELGLDIRTAIHTGEVEMRGDDLGGIGVHIAARALSEAADRSVVVTRTVRDLATGTDLVFTPLGSVGLRGVPEQWELFEASIGTAPNRAR
jgi:class 3 adenylate cyclase/dihydrofolate reductase